MNLAYGRADVCLAVNSAMFAQNGRKEIRSNRLQFKVMNQKSFQKHYLIHLSPVSLLVYYSTHLIVDFVEWTVPRNWRGHRSSLRFIEIRHAWYAALDRNEVC